MTNPPPVQNNNYQVFPFFVGTDDACTSAIYLLPLAFTYAKEINFTVPLLYIGDDEPTETYNNDDFSFSFKKQGSDPASQENVLVSITLLANNMWKCDEQARLELILNFSDFLQNIETEFELKNLLIDGATYIISQQIADRIPAPPIESLYYRYGFISGLVASTLPVVDVLPGMRLQLDSQNSQFLSPASEMNGYVSTGQYSVQINSVATSTGRVISFDPFLGNIKSPTISGDSSDPIVAGGIVDLQPISGQRKHCRMIYPQSMGGPLDPGDQSTKNNVTLISAQTLAQLNAATIAYPNTEAGGTPPNVFTVFLGRAVAIPQIPIWISLNPTSTTSMEYVPIGTTIANIVQRFTVLPLDTNQHTVAVQRNSSATGSSTRITFFTDGLLANTSTLFDIPLISGDVITLNF